MKLIHTLLFPKTIKEENGEIVLEYDDTKTYVVCGNQDSQ